MATKSPGEAFTDAIEEVARENAQAIGFDVVNEPYGLARAIMVVLSSKELREKAIKRAKEMVEGAKDVQCRY